MARKSKEVEEAADVFAPEPEAKVSKKNADSVTVSWRGGTRTYTRELHGDAFADLAEEFAEKKGGKVV